LYFFKYLFNVIQFAKQWSLPLLKLFGSVHEAGFEKQTKFGIKPHLTKQLNGPFTALVVCAHSAPLHFCTNNQRCKRPLIAALAVKIFLKPKK